MASREEVFTAVIRLNDKEATSKLDNMQKQLEAVKRRRDEALREGRIDVWKAANKEAEKLAANIDKQKQYIHAMNHSLQSLSTANQKELQEIIKSINRQLNSGAVERNSEEWKHLNSALKDAKRELSIIKKEGEQQPGIWGRFFKFLNDSWGGVLIIFQTITGLSQSVRKSVQDYAKMEEAMADTRKYTGLTDEAIRDLNEDLKKMDTRTSREELNELAGAAGRLGKTAKQDILEFVDAGNMIKVALGDDLGEGAIDKVGKLAMAFGEDEKMGLRGAMLATGSAVNELAQNSSAQAGYLVDFTARVAGFGKQLGLTQAQIMGFGAVMDENLLRDEMAATAFGNMLTKMQLDTAKFAKIAGMNVKEFTKLLNEDANEAILRLADSLKRADSQTMMKMLDEMGLDGSRAVGVLATLADKIDDVRARQQLATKAYKEGVSVQKEYATMNNTVEASIEKAKKRFMEMSVALGERLQPVVKYTINTGSALIKVLSVLTEFLFENYKTILTLTAAISGVTAAWYAHTIAVKVSNAVETVSIALKKSHAAVVNTLKQAYVAWRIIIAAATRDHVKLNSAMVDAKRLQMTNIWAALATVVLTVTVAIIGAVKAWKKHQEAIQNSRQEMKNMRAEQKLDQEMNKQVSESIAEQKTKTEQLSRIIHSNAYTIDERRKAIKAMQGLVPDYHASISNEGKLYNENSTAIKNYIQDLQDAAMAEAIYAKKVEINKKKVDLNYKEERIQGSLKAVQAYRDANPEAMKNGKTAMSMSVTGISTEIETKSKAAIESARQEKVHKERLAQVQSEKKVVEAEEQYLDKVLEKNEKVNQLYTNKVTTGDATGQQSSAGTTYQYETEADAKQRKKEEEERKKQLKERAEAAKASWQEQVAEEMLAYQQGISSYTNYMEEKHNLTQNYYDELKRIYGEDSNEYKKALLQQARDEQEYNSWKIKQDDDSLLRDKLEIEHRIRMQYAQQTVRDDRQMNEALFQNEIAYLKKKRNLYKDGSKEQMDIDMKIVQKENQHKYEKEKEWAKLISKYKAESNQQDYDALLEMELKGIESVHKMLIAAGQLTEEEYTQIIENIKRKYAELKAEQAANSDVQSQASKGLDTAKKAAGTTTSDAGDNAATGIFAISQAIENQRLINEALKELYGEDYENNREYQEAKRQLDAETMQSIVAGAQAAYNTINSLLSAASSYAQACSDLELAKITKNYDKQIKAAGNNEKKKQKLEEERDKKIRDAKNKANKRAMAIEMAQAIATTALTALQAYQTGMQAGYPAGLVLGPVAAGLALAAGAIQIATIKKAHEAEAEGYYEGGFTGGKRYKKEAGVVHEGEFVANHQAVNNKQLMPVLSLIDQAQRSNRVGQLRAEDVTNVMGGAASAAVVAPVVNVQTDNAELQDGLGALNEAVDNLNVQLEEGIHVNFVFDGPNGFDSNYRKFKRLKE